MGEAEFFSFGDTLIGAEGGADFATKADFAEHYEFFREFTAGDGGGNGEADCEVGGGILDFEAANDINEDVFIVELEFGAALDDGDEKIEAVEVETGGGAFRVAEV